MLGQAIPPPFPEDLVVMVEVYRLAQLTSSSGRWPSLTKSKLGRRPVGYCPQSRRARAGAGSQHRASRACVGGRQRRVRFDPSVSCLTQLTHCLRSAGVAAPIVGTTPSKSLEDLFGSWAPLRPAEEQPMNASTQAL